MDFSNYSQKPTKSIIWMVATIWVNIIIIGLICGVIVYALTSFLSSQLILVTESFFVKLILGIKVFTLFVFVPIYGVRLGIKSVLKKSIILKENIIKISIGVAMVALMIQLVLIILTFPIEIKTVLEFIGNDIFYFLVTYFWLKKLV